MKFPKLLETLTRSPLLMTPGSVESILTLFQNHASMSSEDFAASREGRDVCGGKVELEEMSIEDGVALIPVKGPLGVGLDAFEKGAGCTDYEDIIKDIKSANENPQVENIIGVFDTPGGTWGGLLECASAISESEKPFYVFVPAGCTAASAGMFLAACASGRFLSPSSQAGSIGVYCAYMDTSERAEKMGIKVKVFSSGKFKGQFLPGTALSMEQEEHLQDYVMELAQEFYDHMRANLGDIPDDAMQGQMFRAAQAVKLGFADEVISGIDDLKEFLK